MLIIIIIFIGFIVCWNFSEIIFEIIRKPISPHLPTGGLVFTAPMDKFLAHIKVSLFAGMVVSCPLWIYQLWAFIAPGLYRKEKKYSLVFMFAGTCLFLTGVSFVYFVVYPLAFDFLMNFGGGEDKPMITINEYLSFFTTTTLVFGAVFEMPLIFAILAMMGIVEKQMLVKFRRFAIVILAACSAIFTPPDVISMILMMIPMLLLYEISVFLVGVLEPPPIDEDLEDT